MKLQKFEEDGETYISTAEYCKRRGVSRQYIFSLIKQGKLKRYRFTDQSRFGVNYLKESELKPKEKENG